MLGKAALLLQLCFSLCAALGIHPEQVHISYGASPTEMVVTWNTVKDSPGSIVQYGISSLDNMASGRSEEYTYIGIEMRIVFIHRVTLTGLLPGQKYNYRCGCDASWSKNFTFPTMKAGQDWSPRLAVFGDLGLENARIYPALESDVKKEMYDAIIHAGDIAYDMYEDEGAIGDEFMRLIEPVAANVPYMTCVGNHEAFFNFTHYANRFTMPGGDGSNHFFSFDMGPAHIIAFSTEFHFHLFYGVSPVFEQHKWLEKELQEANKPENRAKHPWVIVFGHRPMYCSNNDCPLEETTIRKGIPSLDIPGFEDMFYKYGVDLEIWGHEHSYERLWPVYDGKVYNGSLDAPYVNPKAPVHIITGAAGNHELKDMFKKDEEVEDWSAFRHNDYSYSRMTIHNATHLHWQHVSVEQGNLPVDDIWIVKDRHGPYTK